MFEDPLMLADGSDDTDVLSVLTSKHPQSEPNTPSLTWPLIFPFVGAHILAQEDWHCSQCKPRWHNWYCRHCGESVPPAWTPQKHFGGCGQRCSCCRFKVGASGSCEACKDLWILKATSGEVRLALLSYNGR